jgi:hypothetical protein
MAMSGGRPLKGTWTTEKPPNVLGNILAVLLILVVLAVVALGGTHARTGSITITLATPTPSASPRR